MKPVIGIVADVQAGGKHVTHSAQQKYLAAVATGSDAIPLIIPVLPTSPEDLSQILALLDGICLTGALSNVAPAQYNTTQRDPNSPADPARDHIALALIRQAVALGLPTLGICRGFQEINVALGGTLHQSIHTTPGLNDHREDRSLDLAGQYAPAHTIEIAPGGLLHMASGITEARVNSVHTQGIDRLAPTLAVEATAPDGLIEAFRLDRADSFLLGVQWHPEWRWDDDPLSTIIFRSFGTAARAFQKA